MLAFWRNCKQQLWHSHHNELLTTYTTFIQHGFLTSSLTYQHANSCVFFPGCIGTLQSHCNLRDRTQNTPYSKQLLIDQHLYFYFYMHRCKLQLPSCTCITLPCHLQHDLCSKLGRNTNSHLRGIFSHYCHYFHLLITVLIVQVMAGCDVRHPGGVGLHTLHTWHRITHRNTRITHRNPVLHNVILVLHTIILYYTT